MDEMTDKPPLIGCTTNRKRVSQARPIDVYGLMPSYTEAITAAGGIPVLIPMGLSEDDLQLLSDRLDAIMLPGGGDLDPVTYNGRSNGKIAGIDRERDRTEIYMAQAAVKTNKPILAICRGLQVLNVALGGSLWEDISSQIPGALNHDLPDSMPRNFLSHTVDVSPGSRLSRLTGYETGKVNSIHHQSIRRIAADLTVTATAPDDVIEAVEIDGHPFALGVQWHPENLIHDNTAMLSIFEGLVRAARNGHSRE